MQGCTQAWGGRGVPSCSPHPNRNFKKSDFVGTILCQTHHKIPWDEQYFIFIYHSSCLPPFTAMSHAGLHPRVGWEGGVPSCSPHPNRNFKKSDFVGTILCLTHHKIPTQIEDIMTWHHFLQIILSETHGEEHKWKWNTKNPLRTLK